MHFFFYSAPPPPPGRRAASPPSFRRTWQKSMTRCQTDRMHNDGSSRQHGRQQRAWPGHGHKTKERKAVGWLGPGRGRVAWPFSQTPARPSFFERRSHDSEFCVVSVGRRRREFEATSSDVADGGVAASEYKGAMYQAMHCCREKQGIQQTAIRRRRIRCFLHSPSDANCIFGRPWRADWPDWATAVCLAFSARVPDCRFASNRTVAVRLRGESQQCVLSPLVCRQHGKQNLFFNQRRQIKRSR